MSDITKLQVGLGLTLGFVGAALAIGGMPAAGWFVFTMGLISAIVVESLVVRLGGALLISCLLLAVFALVCAPESDPIAALPGPSNEPPATVGPRASGDVRPVTPPMSSQCHPDLRVKVKVAYRLPDAEKPTLERVLDECEDMHTSTLDGWSEYSITLESEGGTANLTFNIPDTSTWGGRHLKIKEDEVKGGPFKGEDARLSWLDGAPGVPSEFRGMYGGATGKFTHLEDEKRGVEFVGLGFEGTLEGALATTGVKADIVAVIWMRVR